MAEAEVQDRRVEILAVAAELFADKGARATTVREIADAVGMLSGSLYHHFSSKDEILEEIITTFIADLLDRYTAVLDSALDPADQFVRLVHESFAAMTRHPHAAAVYQANARALESSSNDLLRTAGARIQETWLQVIETGVQAGVLRDDVDTRTFYRLCRDALWLSARWYRPGGAMTLERLASDFTAIFLEGFSRRPTTD